MDKIFSTITELPDTLVTELQLHRAHQRYLFASEYCNGGHVVEIGCGGGQGLDLLSRNVEIITGCDVDESNVETAKNTYNSHPKVTIKKMDAEKLLFDDDSIDTILLFETIYYINQVKNFFLEAHRILKEGGYLIICTANKDWSGFNPSPFSTQYFSVPELYQLATLNGFTVNMFASFPAVHKSLFSKLASFIKWIVVKLHLMPKTMKGKVLLKKLFIGKMVTYPEELTDDLFDYTPPIQISHDKIDKIHTAIFAVCKKL